MIDTIIVIIYLIVTLITGVLFGRNIKNINNFSIADKNFSTAVLVATITSTFLGGGDTFGGGEKSFKYGLVFLLFFVLSNFIYSMIIAYVIAPQIDKYKGCISIGDIMKREFGKKAQILTGVAGSFKDTTIIGAQLSAMGYVCNYFLDISHGAGIIIAGGVVVIYSVFGGMKSVTITDVIQFIVLIVAIPMIANIGLHKVNGFQQLITSLPLGHLKFFTEDKSSLIHNIDVALVIMLTIVGPTGVQRLLMARNAIQAKRAFCYSGIIYSIVLTMICIIGLTAKILSPDLNPNMAVPYIVNLLPSGFRGLAIAGLLAVIMSTADSLLNAVAVLLINDVINPLANYKINDTKKLQLARFATFFIGLFSIISAVSFESVLNIVMFGHVFWSPIIVAPFFFSLIGFKLSKHSFWYSVIGAVAVVITWRAFRLEEFTGISSTLPGMLTSATILITIYYYVAFISHNKILKKEKKYSKKNL